MERLELSTKIVVEENGCVTTQTDIDGKGCDLDLLTILLKLAKQNEDNYKKKVDSYRISKGLKAFSENLEIPAEAPDENSTQEGSGDTSEHDNSNISE